MFIEVTVGPEGEIIFGWCADTTPVDARKPLYTNPHEPMGSRRVRAEITTTEALTIDERAYVYAIEQGRRLLDIGDVEGASEVLSRWRQYRLLVIRRDLRIDGPEVQAPMTATAPGIPWVRARLVEVAP